MHLYILPRGDQKTLLGSTTLTCATNKLRQQITTTYPQIFIIYIFILASGTLYYIVYGKGVFEDHTVLFSFHKLYP